MEQPIIDRPFYICPATFTSGWPQVMPLDHKKSYNVRSPLQLPHVPLTVSDQFPSIFQDILNSLSCITYLSGFYIPDLRSAETWRLRLRNSKPMGKYSNNSDSENNGDVCFISSLLFFNNSIYSDASLSFSLLGVLIQAWGQIRSTEVKWRFC